MKNLKKIMSVITALAVVASAAITVNAGIAASAEEAAAAATYSVKEYTPDKYDLADFYGAGGDIEPTAGDGVTTFAHAGLITPLEGENISFDTNFQLLSKKSTLEGGSGVDGWLTYSFTKAAINTTAGDSVVPNYGSQTAPQGIFMHITNYSGTTAPNCVEVQFVQSDGVNGNTPVAASIFLDNAVDVPFNFSLAKQEDGTYTWTVTKLSDNTVLKEVTGLAFNSDNFVNENGQTYFSTAIYEGAGCDGNHWEHRGVAIFNVDAYNVDVTADDVVLSQTEYTMEEGGVYKPEVTVTVGGEQLVDGEDYQVEYLNNDAVGTATAKVSFYGALGGNVVEKEFTIVEPEIPESSSEESSSEEEVSSEEVSSEEVSSEEASSEEVSSAPEASSEEASSAPEASSEAPAASVPDSEAAEQSSSEELGCFGSISFGAVGAMLALAGVAIASKKRK